MNRDQYYIQENSQKKIEGIVSRFISYLIHHGKICHITGDSRYVLHITKVSKTHTKTPQNRLLQRGKYNLHQYGRILSDLYG